MHLQIAILHAHNTFNSGSFMMLINFIWYWAELAPENSRTTFWIELDGPENIERLLEALPLGSLEEKGIKIKPLPLKITSEDHASFLRKLFRLFSKLFCHGRSFKQLGIDSIIILGGDDISEYYKKAMILSDLFRIFLYSRNFPTILAGQTIGPFTGIRKKAASRFLSGTNIYSRDRLTTGYLLDQLNIPADQVHDSADLSFPDLPGTGTDPGKNNITGMIPDNYICLVPGGYYSLYTANRNKYIEAWSRLVRDLLDGDFLQNRKIVFLPHVTRPEDDREIIRSIVKTLSGQKEVLNNVVMVDEELYPDQLRHILGNAYLTISSRMHAALSSFQMRKPAVAIGYSVKYEGVIGDSVGCPMLVIPSQGNLLMDPDLFSSQVLQKIQYVKIHYNEIRIHLDKRIPELSAMAREQINEISIRLMKSDLK